MDTSPKSGKQQMMTCLVFEKWLLTITNPKMKLPDLFPDFQYFSTRRDPLVGPHQGYGTTNIGYGTTTADAGVGIGLKGGFKILIKKPIT